MNDYSNLARQLGTVRRAWKRTAALAGLAVTCLEMCGVLALAFLIDWIYQPLPAWRMILFAAVLASLAALLLRHVVRPLLRRISDDQVAMFIEEHNDKFEGALITAAEFGSPGATSIASKPFVDAVVRSAVQRAKTINVRAILDFRRLRKYGIAALAVLAAYGVLAIAVPDVTRHAGRVLAPWHKRSEDMVALDRAALMRRPITFRLSKENTDLLRGASFDLEAVLSRRSDNPVQINFRPAADVKGEWRMLAMQEMDKLNGFKTALQDVNEDMNFYVSAGQHRSEVFKISVFDPLVVQSVELRTKYPDYLKLPEKVEVFTESSAADIAAPETSQVRFKIAANRPLKAGTVTVTDAEDDTRQQVALVPEAQEKGAAIGTLEVKRDGTYEYEVNDAVGQKIASTAHGYIRVLRDGPPTMEVKHPVSTKTPVPIGEVTFSAAVEDDLALAGVEVVYERQFPDASAEPGVPVRTQAGRLPLELKGRTTGAFPEKAEATGRLLLEKLDPAAKPEDIISYYLECTDRKGQKVVSEIQTIAVQHYDNWVSVTVKNPHEPTFNISKNIEEYVKMTWALHQAREKLAKPAFAKSCEELADSMTYDKKRLYPFYNPKKIPANKKLHARKADEYIQSGHDALKAEDTGKAVADFRIAAAELKICGISENSSMEMFTGNFGKPGNEQEAEKKKDSKFFEKIVVEVAKVPIPQEYLDKIKAAEDLKKASAELEKKQAEIAQKAVQLAKQENRPDAMPQQDKKDAAAKNQKDAAARKQDAKDQAAKTDNAEKKDADKKDADDKKDQDAQAAAGKKDAEEKKDQKAGAAGKKDAEEKKDQKAGAAEGKKDQQDQNAKAGDADKKAGDEAKKNETADSLAAKQEKVADETRREANKAKGDQTADPAARKMAGRMEDAAREMKDATRNLREGKVEEAAAAAERARKELMQIATGADQLRQEKLAEAIAQAEKEAGRILNRQRELTAQTQAAAKTPADQQDKEFKKLAFQQAQLKADAEAVKDAVKELNTFAQKEAKLDTAKPIEESHRQMDRGQVDQKMANAVVELTGKQSAPAVQEQQKAEALLATVVDNLRQAGDSMASDTEAELRRAAAEAAKIDEGLQKLGASEPEPKPADQAQKEKTSDQAKGKPQADAGDKSKPQDQKKETKPAGAADDAAKQAAAQPSDKQDAGKEKKQPGVPDDKTKQAAQPSDKKDADKDAKQALTPDDKAKQTAQASDKQDADKEKKQALTPADQAKQAAAQPPATDKKDGKQDDRQADKKDGKPDGKKDGKQETKPDGARDDLAKSPDSQSATDAADNKDKENRKPLSDQEKKDLAESLTYDMQRLAAHLDNRQFVEKKDAETLARRTQDSVALARVLQEENNPKREELAALIRRVRNKLEADYQAQLDSKRLVAAQNEECPPAYRHLVNKYYEVLSQEKK